MQTDLMARASTTINAPVSAVWQALVTPTAIKQYMFGTDVTSTWKEGAAISWKGEWKGKPYQDKGVILQLKPQRLLQYTHFSPLAGLPDAPENYHTVTMELSGEGEATRLVLSQDNNRSEEARQHSEKNWASMLTALKSFLER